MTKAKSVAATAGLATCLLAIVLAGCVGAATSSKPAIPSSGPGQTGVSEPVQTPAGTSLPESAPPGYGSQRSPYAPAPTPSSVPGESGPDTTVVTMADNGTTLHLPVGRRFSLSLDGGVVWTLKGSDESVVRQVQASLPSGGQGTYETVAPGTSTLGGSGKPHCSGDGACPMFLLEFRVTIVVS